MKRKLLFGFGLVAMVALSVGVYTWRTRQVTKEFIAELNSPRQMAVDECVAAASADLQAVFTQVCESTPAIERHSKNCATWSSAAIFKFMNRHGRYPEFKNALAVWSEQAQKCHDVVQ